MAEAKRKLRLLGAEIEVAEVSIKNADEPFSEYLLDDGSKIRVKSVATSIVRIVDQFSPDGKPVYLVTTSPVVFVVESPLTQGGT